MKRVLLISPHLDDAVLSAGQFMAGRRGDCDVLTVFSGIPMEEGVFTIYDKKCGFNNSKDAMVIRRMEEENALALLNATPSFLNRMDEQYSGGDYKGLEAQLARIIKKGNYEFVLSPLGLRHPDHVKLSDAAVNAAKRAKADIYLWEDLPHRVTHPELVTERLDLLSNYKPELTFIGDGEIADKVRALWCYKSQMLTGDLNPYNLYVKERFWKI